MLLAAEVAGRAFISSWSLLSIFGLFCVNLGSFQGSFCMLAAEVAGRALLVEWKLVVVELSER